MITFIAGAYFATTYFVGYTYCGGAQSIRDKDALGIALFIASPVYVPVNFAASLVFGK